MEEMTFSPHPITGAPGTYRLVDGVGYVQVSEMDVSNERDMRQDLPDESGGRLPIPEGPKAFMDVSNERDVRQDIPDESGGRLEIPEGPKAFAGQIAAPGSGTGLLGTNTPDTNAARSLLQGFQQTAEMVEADAAMAASNPTDNPDEWTFVSGIGQHVYHGPYAGKNTATQMGTYMNSHLGGPSHDANRQWKTGAHGYHFGGDMMAQNEGLMNSGVYGNFTQDSWDKYHAAGGSGNPLIDTSPHDIPAILELYKTEGFNPYVGMNEEVMKGSVADYMYGLTKNDLTHRGNVWRGLRNGQDLGSTRMNELAWNKYGFNDTIGDYAEYGPANVANPMAGNTGGGSSLFETLAGNDFGNPMNGQAPRAESTFMKSYNDRRRDMGARPSVSSLFEEIKNFK